MKKFTLKLVWFTIPMVFFSILGLLLPATPRASKSLLFANQKKDELLQHVKPPRMIFVGGSNLSFGLNSQIIKNELNIEPINTAVHAGIGLRYMLENTIQYIKEEDIVILALEYHHFYRDYNSTSEELLRTIFDVDPSKVKLLNFRQMIGLIPFLPKYILSKTKPSEYFNVIESDVYSVNSFNKYGDTYTHWEMESRPFKPYGSIRDQFNKSVIQNILEFQAEVTRKGATLLVTYPGFQDISYENSIKKIEIVSRELETKGFVTLGYPDRYKMPSDMMFDTPYHLNKEGVDHRTRLFIDDYLKLMSEKKRGM